MEWIQLAEVGSSGGHSEVDSQISYFETAGAFSDIWRREAFCCVKTYDVVVSGGKPKYNDVARGRSHSLNSSETVS